MRLGWMAFDEKGEPVEYTFTFQHPRYCWIRAVSYFNLSQKELEKRGMTVKHVEVKVRE